MTTPNLGGVRDALAAHLRAYGRERLELEFRFGHRIAGKFVPGVDHERWTGLKDHLDRATPRHFDMVATETRELISNDGSGGKYVIPLGGGDGAAPSPFWMHKKRLSDTDIETDGPWCCRASMSLEVVDPADQHKPAPTGHVFERHKQRWSYRYRCWSLDLTRVVSNLPHQLDNDGVSYELEIELRDTSELFVRPMDLVLEWGWDLVTDMCRLL